MAPFRARPPLVPACLALLAAASLSPAAGLQRDLGAAPHAKALRLQRGNATSGDEEAPAPAGDDAVDDPFSGDDIVEAPAAPPLSRAEKLALKKKARLEAEKAEEAEKAKIDVERNSDEFAEQIMFEHKNGHRGEQLEKRDQQVAHAYKRSAEDTWNRIEGVRELAAELAVYNVTTLVHVKNIRRWINQLRSKLTQNTTRIAQQTADATRGTVMSLPTHPPPVSQKHSQAEDEVEKEAHRIEDILEREQVGGYDSGGS